MCIYYLLLHPKKKNGQDSRDSSDFFFKPNAFTTWPLQHIEFRKTYKSIGGGTCLKVGGPRKIVTEMHVQMRAGNDCNYSRYCLMFLFN